MTKQALSLQLSAISRVPARLIRSIRSRIAQANVRARRCAALDHLSELHSVSVQGGFTDIAEAIAEEMSRVQALPDSAFSAPSALKNPKRVPA